MLSRGPAAPMLGALFCASFVSFAAALPAQATDLAGYWRTEVPASPLVSDRFIRIEQSGDEVSFEYPSLPASYGGAFQGTLVGDQLEVRTSTLSAGFSLAAKGQDTVLEGSFRAGSFGYPPYHLLIRCECFDGNTDDGDGCDSDCRLEPCFTCTGDPSSCYPSADGDSCNDRHDCTTGETCTAGACAGGLPLASCSDATGRWLEYSVSNEPNGWNGFFGEPTEVEEVSIEQERGFVISRRGSGQIWRVGEVDQNTGTLRVHSPAVHFFCGLYYSETLTIRPDGSGYGGTGRRFLGILQFSCAVADDVTVTGLRCAGGESDSGPCLVDSCVRCSSTPESCVPLSDSTPCRHDDTRTAVGTCNAGSCVATVSSVCPACQEFDGYDCVPRPRHNCRKSIGPHASRLRLNARDQWTRHEVVRWDWKGGEATSLLDLGIPQLSSGIALCVFDAGGKTWDEATVARFQPGLPCDVTQTCDPGSDDEPGGWRSLATGSFEYEPAGYELDTEASIHAGLAGESSSRVVMHGGELWWGTPLALPVRAQLQIDGGACFESTFDEAAVRKNDHNLFRARIRN